MSDKWRQFSIRYLFLETLWIALGIGFTRFAVVDASYNPELAAFGYIAVPAAIVSFGTAIGGLYGSMKIGCLVATWLGVAFLLFPRAFLTR